MKINYSRWSADQSFDRVRLDLRLKVYSSLPSARSDLFPASVSVLRVVKARCRSYPAETRPVQEMRPPKLHRRPVVLGFPILYEGVCRRSPHRSDPPSKSATTYRAPHAICHNDIPMPDCYACLGAQREPLRCR